MIAPASKWWRNYHQKATPPKLPARTREAIAARNRAMQSLAPRLGLIFQPMDAAGNLHWVKVAA